MDTLAWHSAEDIRPDLLRGGTVLVVDDEASVRRIIRRVLEENQCTVLEAADGESALRIVEQHPAALDLVITDLIMPGIGGRDVAEVLSIFRPDLPLLGISGYPDSTVADRRLPILSKPFTVGELLAWACWSRVRSRGVRGHSIEQRRRARRLRELSACAATQTTTLVEAAVDLVGAAHELRRMGPP